MWTISQPQLPIRNGHAPPYLAVLTSELGTIHQNPALLRPRYLLPAHLRQGDEAVGEVSCESREMAGDRGQSARAPAHRATSGLRQGMSPKKDRIPRCLGGAKELNLGT